MLIDSRNSRNNRILAGVLKYVKRSLSLTLRLLAVAVGVLVLFLVAARLYFAHQINRASQMLSDLQAIRVSESEQSIEPLLSRLDAVRWNVQLGELEDYNYVVEVNPWGFPTIPRPNSGRGAELCGAGICSTFRRVVGLRHWAVFSEIAIKDHKVAAVQVTMFVEGRTVWLGTAWRLSQRPREFARDPTAKYLQWPPKPDLDFVSTGILEMGTGAGDYWGFWLKPSSARVQRRVATGWNVACLNSFRGCDSLCELLPNAAPFFRKHSELAPNGGGWDENSRTCKHSPDEGAFE